METTDPAGIDSTRSLLTIDLNCPSCFNATVEALEADSHVTTVRAHSAAQCLEVTHTGPVDRVLGTINRMGHTIEVASNGEAVMTPPKVQVQTSCDRHRTPAIARITIGPVVP